MVRRLFWFVSISAICCTLVLVSSSAAGAGKDQHFGPFASTSPDNGSCGHAWAIDTFDRFFNVHDNGNGTFSVDEQFKNGSFVTIGGDSPSACAPDSHHGSAVEAGVNGTFVGYLDFTVTGGTYNPSGCATGDCTTLAGFLAATFPGGSFGCGPSGVCKFGFEYAAGDQNLLYHHWADVSDKTGNDLFRGDIANE
jgi:hypothetical protein